MSRRIPGEAFAYYAGLGAGRSYEAVAEHFGVSKRAVTRVAHAEDWQRRVTELEAKARQGTEQRVLESLAEMHDRHLRMLRVIQTRALEVLRSLPLTSAIDAVRALALTIREERLTRGEPGGAQEADLEQLIRSDYTRWLRVAGEPEPAGQRAG